MNKIELMEYKKYKLGEICKIFGRIGFRGYTTEDLVLSPSYGAISLSPSNIVDGIMDLSKCTYISWAKYEESPEIKITPNDIVIVKTGNSYGRTAIIRNVEHPMTLNPQFVVLKDIQINPVYLAYFLKTDEFQKQIYGIVGGSAIPTLSQEDLASLIVRVPNENIPNTIADILDSLDGKIELNKLINDNLEAMAKQLYDYWFVQFDFPNEEGKPYKSSGGAMVWNEELHMNIPYSWNTCLLNDYIGSNNTGDWGFDEPAEKRNMKVGCIRGADIVKLNDLPTRYIKDSNTSKLLSVWDIVIEVSGGSPTQATGRSAFVTPGVLKRNGGNLTCSNFCHAFTMKNYKASAYFFFMWRMFYDNNNMFNYEGKTSGIKNFMTDTFLANKWLDVPTALLDLFFERIKVIYEQIDNNIEEINALTKQRDELHKKYTKQILMSKALPPGCCNAAPPRAALPLCWTARPFSPRAAASPATPARWAVPGYWRYPQTARP